MVRIANAPCSWGVIEGIEGDGGGYRRVIDEIAETGYVGTELGDWGFMPTNPDELRSELDARPAAHAEGSRVRQAGRAIATVGAPPGRSAVLALCSTSRSV